MSVKSKVTFVFGLLGKTINFIRLMFLNVFFLVTIGLIYVAVSQLKPPAIPDDAILWLNPTGVVVEQYSFNDPIVRLLNPDQLPPETSRDDIVKALKLAAKDDRIKAVVISPDLINGIGLSAIASIHSAVDEFKSTGKPVLARSRGMQQHQYLLSSKADSIFIHPMSYIAVNGYGAYREYMKDALDKLSIDVHVFRVGEYKSAMEPYLRNNMSGEARQANKEWLTSLWGHYKSVIAFNRNISPEQINEYANDYATILQQASGSSSQAALNTGLIDKVLTDDQFNHYLTEHIFKGGDNNQKNRIGLRQYLAANTDFSAAAIKPLAESSVAVVTLEGAIVDGEAPAGNAGGDTIAGLLRKAKNNKAVAAVVLRVNSGGGSAFASEIIREQVSALQKAGKPVVVSMSNVAASGGYWVAANADQIWASPTTITGSIGIFAAIPTAHRAFNKLGVYNDGVGTTALSDGFSLSRPLNPQLSITIQNSIERGYDQFIDLVSEGRNMDRAQTLAAAGGRVWTGAVAQKLGLVDYLGEYNDAINAAAELAGINTESEPNVIHLYDEKWAELSIIQRFISVLEPKIQFDMNGIIHSAIKQWLPVWLLKPDRNNVYLRCVECGVVE